MFLLAVWKQPSHIRFRGVCFGHQVLCRALDATVEPSPGEEWELSQTQIKLTPTGEALFRTREKIFLHQMHVDHVVNAPTQISSKGLITDDALVTVWRTSDIIPIQGVYICERLYTSQGQLGYNKQMAKRQVKLQDSERGGLNTRGKPRRRRRRQGLTITVLKLPLLY